MSVFGDDFSAGPIFDRFPLTIGEGHRTEILGPIYYNELNDTSRTWAFPPFFSRQADPTIDELEIQSLYPVFSYVKYGTQYRAQFFQLFSVAGGENPNNVQAHRLWLFPVYFQQRSSNTNENYTAVFPFYGNLKNFLFRNQIHFVMFPAYSQTHLKDVVNYNYFYPFYNVRYGNGMHGWQFWPFYGTEHKVVTLVTNTWGVETSGGHDHRFIMWPIHFRENNGIGTDNPEKLRADIPFYVSTRSPKRDWTSVLWPFFNRIDDRERKYREWEMPWPIIVVAHGPGKHALRIFPFYNHAYNDSLTDTFYAWPFYKYDSIYAPPLDRRRTRILFFLYQNTFEQHTVTRKFKRRVDLWPLALYTHDFDGSTRLQLLALAETFFPNSPGIERTWSPLWSVWRSEKNPTTEANSQSLLWNLYRRDASPGRKKISCMFGLYQYESNPEGKKLRLFYIPVRKH
ncbi:MAG TPA: hypothetical protein VH280_06615 [Verrucomicrobiae bacterium]|nr:hypothetical protein [Verrucomicrobiae bacterium]